MFYKSIDMNAIVLAKSRSHCPIASTLDLVGDKWSLILVRDMITGKKKFGEFLDSPEGIPTNILTNRLKQMEQLGLIKKQQYQDRPKRFEYVLTEHGRTLPTTISPIPGFRPPGLWRRRSRPDRSRESGPINGSTFAPRIRRGIIAGLRSFQHSELCR